MSQHLMKKAIDAAKAAFMRKEGSFSFCGITIRIEHAHSNNYQVLLPDGSEFVRLVAGNELRVLMD